MSRQYARLVRCIGCKKIKDTDNDADALNLFNSARFCPACGETCGWYNSTEYWTSTAKWYKPSTWGEGYWTRKEMDHGLE